MKYTGYTLIELIVVIALLGIVLSVGLISWNNYQEKEFLNTQSQDLVFWLRSIRSQALFGEKPQDCESLVRYEIEEAANSFTAVPICINGGVEQELTDYASEISINEEITLTLTNFPFSFISNSGGTTYSSSVITLEYRGNETEIEITKSGKISWTVN